QKLWESIFPDMSSLPRRNSEGLRHNAPICTLQTVPYAYISSMKAMATVKNSPYQLVLKQT
ncbi:hypothetical protein B7P43_G12904, partial [Cryptotermes secundus]